MSVRNGLSRRAFLRLSALGASALVAACAPKVVEKVVKETVVVEKAVEKVVKETVIVAGTPKVVEKVVTQVVEVAPKTAEELLPPGDRLGSPDHVKGWKTTLPDLPPRVPHTPPVVITGSRRVNLGTKFAEGDDLENNPWSRMIKALFGVEFKVAWSWATSDEAQTKYNLCMASGDLPDLLETVPMTIFPKMVEAGNLLKDLTDAYDMYASPRWKETWREWGDLPWVYTEVDGRKWGLQRTELVAQDDTCLWYHEEWLEKLGLDVPKTLDELHDVAKAIVDADIGKGAPGTTIGLLANKECLHNWYGSLDPIWGAYGLITKWSNFGWRKEKGGLSWDGIRPEVKDVLALLNQWYNDGIFRDDFFTLSTSDGTQDIDANKCGLHFTPSWGAALDAVKNDPETRWNFADIPTGPGGRKGKASVQANPFIDPFCFRKDFEHLEEWFQVANWMIELTEDPWRRFHGWEGANYEWEGDKIKSTGIGWEPWTFGPIGTRGGGGNDPLRKGRLLKYQMDEWGKVPPEKRDAQMNLFFEDPTGVQQISREAEFFLFDHRGDGIMDQFQSLPTPTMVERGSDLGKLLQETLIACFIGEKPLDAFDDFVESWKKMGGDKVTEEVNEWWASKK